MPRIPQLIIFADRFSLEQAINPDNEVRLIDLFVNALPLKQYGFKVEYVDWHEKKNSGGRKGFTLMQQFTTPACKGCLVKHLCTANPRGHNIERSEYTPFYEQNRRNVDIHMKNIKYSLDTFIFGNNFKIPAGL